LLRVFRPLGDKDILTNACANRPNDHSQELWRVKNTFLSAAIRNSAVRVNLCGTVGCVSEAASFHAPIGPEIGAATCHNYL
jgi:hypothetical protein